MKKTLGAVVAGFVVQMVGLVSIHSLWLKQDYMITAPVWRAPEAQQARVWAMLLGTLIYAAGAVLIYIRGVEQKPWIGQGVRFGVLMALVTVVYSSLSGWVILPVPHMLVVKWIVGESVLCVAFGMVVAGICQPRWREPH
jgi:hypothetical protein